jgi:hypothetical protein
MFDPNVYFLKSPAADPIQGAIIVVGSADLESRYLVYQAR